LIMKNNLKNWQGTACVIGVDFGDSGKGRLVDELATRAHIVARYNGGSNAGHTVKNKFGKFALHIMPSGIFNPKTICLIGRGVAANLESLVLEMETVKKVGVSLKNLLIDEQATITMPWHMMRESFREEIKSSSIGTTRNGVGPTYVDRTERVGLRIKDLTGADFKDKFAQEAKIQNKIFNLKLNVGKILKKYTKIRKIIKPHVASTVCVLKNAQKQGKNILFEGAQGWLLDIDFGTYPFVTSSNTGVLGIWRSFDIHPSEINHVIGLTKSYLTRVGAGPMPTKIGGKIEDKIVEIGQEFGTTTGRRRDIGWLDLVILKSAAKSNRLTSLAVTKLDVLSGLKKIYVCTAYKKAGIKTGYIIGNAEYLRDCDPVYEQLPGWNDDISKVRNFAKLPKNAQRYLKRIEKFIDVSISFISVGPARGDAIYV